MQKICNGDPYRPIKVECWAFGKNSTHKSMGECTFSIDEIKKGRKKWSLIKTKQSGDKKDKGDLILK